MKNIKVRLEKRDMQLLVGLMADMKEATENTKQQSYIDEIVEKCFIDLLQQEIENIDERLANNKAKTSTAKIGLSVDKMFFCLLICLGSRFCNEYYDEANRIMIGEVMSKIIAAYK
jgi:hypothetical protein